MYAAKKGGGPVQLYDRDKDRNTIRHLTLSGALRQAIEGGQLSFEFQPKLDLLAGTIRSVEALARWRHPAQGAILPDEFIPHAEKTGLIQPFTHWSFDAALAQLALWQRRRPRHQRRGQPLDPQPARRGPAGDHRDLLGKWRVDPRLLTLELTETAVMHDPDARAAQPVPAARARASACRSTTSAPAIRRSRICSACRCTSSRSTSRSCSR